MHAYTKRNGRPGEWRVGVRIGNQGAYLTALGFVFLFAFPALAFIEVLSGSGVLTSFRIRMGRMAWHSLSDFDGEDQGQDGAGRDGAGRLQHMRRYFTRSCSHVGMVFFYSILSLSSSIG